MTEVERRAIESLGNYWPRVASSVADHIWPNHKMRAQGAGGAAARVLARLRKRGLVAWVCRQSGSWGWIKTKAGCEI